MRADARGVRVVKDTDLSGIRAATPDVILATKEKQGDEYADLSKIAPTIMTEGDDWKLNLREHGEALGRTNDSEALLTDWDNRLAKVKRAIGTRKVSVLLIAPTARTAAPGPVGEAVLEDLGIGSGTGGGEVLRIHDGAGMVVGRPPCGPRGARGRGESPLAVPLRPFGSTPIWPMTSGEACPHSSSTPCPASQRGDSAALPMPPRRSSTCWRAHARAGTSCSARSTGTRASAG